jgi:hypothetical protein
MLIAALALTSCVVPRSMAVGQMAAPVGPGATEVGVFGGVLFASQLNPPYSTGAEGVWSQDRHQDFAAPGAEANIQYGFDNQLGLNLHASSAGLQPGLKWTLNRSRVAHVALLPAVAMGYASHAHSTFTAGADGIVTENSPGSVTSFTFLAGLKFLVSHRSGFFAGVGYDLVFNRSLDTSNIGASTDRTEVTTQTLAHQISVSVGVDLAMGLVHIKPELALAVYPAVSSSITTRLPTAAETTVGAWGGFGWAIFPGITLSVATPPRQLTDEEQEIEHEKARIHRRSDEEDDDDEGSDDESRSRRDRDDN